MAVSSVLVGARSLPFHHDVDARWLMAYAAGVGVGEASPCYFDTRRDGGVVGHPLFPVCPEWPVVLAVRDLQLQLGTSLDELRRGIHATHDLHIHRLARAGDRLTTCATVTSMEQRKPGVYLMMRHDTVDAAGQPVATTWQGSLYLGAELDGPARRIETEPAAPVDLAPPADSSPERLHVGALEAHRYTECARIWNPIHTDIDTATRADLPGLILHGTATLAKAVSVVVNRHAGGDPNRVRRVSCRFGGWVAMPSDLIVHTEDRGAGRIALSAATAAGPALTAAQVVLSSG